MSVAGSQITTFYENNARDDLKKILYKFWGLVVLEPEDGFNRTFRKSDVSSFPWPFTTSREVVEIDFLGHCNDHKPLPAVSGKVHPEIDYAVVSTSPLSKKSQQKLNALKQKSLKPICQSKDAEDIEQSNPPSHYVVAEITHGGAKCLYSKLDQLEVDCMLLVAKRADKTIPSILNVVYLAVLVNQEAKSDEIMGFIVNQQAKYPHLFALHQTGRFCYIQYKKTVTYTLAVIDGKLEEVGCKLEEFDGKLEKFDGKLEKLYGQFEEIGGKLEKFDGKLEKLYGKLEKFDGQFEEIGGQLKAVMGKLERLNRPPAEGKVTKSEKYDELFQMVKLEGSYVSLELYEETQACMSKWGVKSAGDLRDLRSGDIELMMSKLTYARGNILSHTLAKPKNS
jgi:uncharacterized coiled-coil protein SlyX/uncharacterized protein YjbJ (UPF0337 family)